MQALAFLCGLTFCRTISVVGQEADTPCKQWNIPVGRIERRLEYLQELVSSPDSDYVRTRETTRTRAAPPGVVKLIDDPTICRQAAAALNRVRNEPDQARELWVYDTGSGYAVDDPSLDATDVDYSDRAIYFFDRRWRHTITLGGF